MNVRSQHGSHDGRMRLVCFTDIEPYRLPAPVAVRREELTHVKSCRHIVRKSNQKPVTASHAMAMPTVIIRGWLKLVRSA